MENAFVIAANGLKHLKSNPILLVPGFTYYFIAVVLSFLFKNFIDLKITSSITMAGLFLLLTTVLSYFTTAGLIGGAKEVVTSGRTVFSDLLFYGRKYCFKLIVAAVFIWALRSLSALFWTPVLRLFLNSEYTAAFVADALMTDPMLLLPLFDLLGPAALLSLFLSSAYFIVVSFLFYFVSFIIVIDETSVFKSYRKSFSLLRKHPIQIVSFVLLMTLLRVLFILVIIIMTAFLIYFQFLSIFSTLLQILISVLFAACMNIWITRFYIVLTKQKMIFSS